MAATLFDAYERSPQCLRWRKDFSSDQSRTLSGIVTTGDLRRKREEQFVQLFLGREVAPQTRPTVVLGLS